MDLQKNINKRWKQHKNDLNNNMHHSNYLQRAWTKYGENNFNFKLMVFNGKKRLLDKNEVKELIK